MGGGSWLAVAEPLPKKRPHSELEIRASFLGWGGATRTIRKSTFTDTQKAFINGSAMSFKLRRWYGWAR